MSYDVSIGDYEDNITINLSDLFYYHIHDENTDVTGLYALNGKYGYIAGILLRNAFTSIHKEYLQLWNMTEGSKAFREKYDAKNKWGETEAGLIFLARLMSACFERPLEKVMVSS